MQAARFLAQSAMGSSRSDIAAVTSQGYAGWLDAQFAMGRRTSLWDWLVANGYSDVSAINDTRGFDPAMWRALISEPDQLRQRTTLALLDFLVVGIEGFIYGWRQFAQAAYVDLLAEHAFGNFRDLLGAITTNFTMAAYLTFLNNRKADPSTGTQPDENYARELLQLFTIGLHQLNPDGSLKLAGGQPIETYSAADVSNLARVFTGLLPDSWDYTTPDRLRRPLIVGESWHETEASTFLGMTVPAGTTTMAAVKLALDAVFAHPNVPPFVSRQLIQRFVTSNPSPAYVARISAVFADNGHGVRGDLKAVVRAILLDSEARSDAQLNSATFGKLREPVMRLTGWARAFGVTSPSNAWAFGDTSSQVNRLGQAIGRSPSVFNFFRPGYVPPNTVMSQNGWLAPEFQITNELSTVAYVNFMQTVITAGMGDAKPDYAAIAARAGDSVALLDEINLLVAAGQVSAATLTTIRDAIDSIADSDPDARVQAAILLVMASPEYLILR